LQGEALELSHGKLVPLGVKCPVRMGKNWLVLAKPGKNFRGQENWQNA